MKAKILIPSGLFLMILAYLIYQLAKTAKNKAETAQKLEDSRANKLNARPYTEAIYNDLSKGFSENSKVSVYTDVTQMSDENIRTIWEDWELHFKTKSGQFKGYSLGAAIDKAWFYYQSSQDASNGLIHKLKTLNLN